MLEKVSTMGETQFRRNRALLRLLACFGVCALIGGPFSRAVAAAGWAEVFVSPDPLVGKDDADAGGAARPFLTIDYAIREVERRFAGQAERSIRFALLPGRYANEPGAGPLNVFPLLVPPGFSAVEFVAQDGPGTVLIQSQDPDYEVFRIRSEKADEVLRARFSGLHIRGGRQAFALLGTASEDAVVRIEDCIAEDQATYGLEASPLEGAFLSIEVDRSIFRNATEGIYVSSPPKTTSSLTVRDCQISGMRRYSPARLLGAGIDLYLEAGSELRARIEHCMFRGVASAVQLTESAESPAVVVIEGILTLDIIGNIVNGLPSPDEPNQMQVENALYFSTNEIHLNTIRVVNNTFVGIHGHVIYSDNLADQALGATGLTPYRFANNICASIGGESEFYDEIFANANEPLGVVFPALSSAILNNLLEKSSLREGADRQNYSGDPGFFDSEAFDFRLKPDSILIDKGSVADTFDAVTDFAGDCRRMSAHCDVTQHYYPPDLGVYEYAGLCDANLTSFVRGDCNGPDGALEISDAVSAFAYLFLGRAQPNCLDACDSNDDGAINITDGVYILNFLFLGLAPPPAPYPEPGADVGRDCLPSCK